MTQEISSQSYPFVMEGNPRFGAALLASAKGSEILCGFRQYVRVELESDAATRLASDSNIEKDVWVRHRE